MKKDVEFPTQDGVTLAAWRSPPDQRSGKVPTIVMAHGFSAVKEMYLDRSPRCSRPRAWPLVFDNRNFGASDGEPRQRSTLGSRCATIATRSLLPRLLRRPTSRIGVWGSSYSGGHVLVVGAIDRRVKCVVAQVPLTAATITRDG